METNRLKDRRVINMEGIPYDTPICRVIHKEHLYKMILEKKNTLVHLKKWDDPFEGFLLKQKVQDGEESLGLDGLFKDYYGQCWSLKEKESDATWRIYSPDKHSILVKSTFGKLWDGFYDKGYDSSSIARNIGKVEYWEEEEIIEKFESIRFHKHLDGSGIELVKSLLIKRKEFEHEKEIRIIHNDVADSKLGNGETMSYPINPHDILDEELIADPRMPDSCFEPLKKALEEKKFVLKKSKLYQLPKLKLKF